MMIPIVVGYNQSLNVVNVTPQQQQRDATRNPAVNHNTTTPTKQYNTTCTLPDIQKMAFGGDSRGVTPRSICD